MNENGTIAAAPGAPLELDLEGVPAEARMEKWWDEFAAYLDRHAPAT